MGRKLRKAQARRYTRTRRREEHWYDAQRIKARESPSHWVWYNEQVWKRLQVS